MDKRKSEDEVEASPFDNLQKNAVLHEARVFNDAQISSRKCIRVMTKLLYLLSQGEQFMSKEITDVFFGVTKLFQSQDPHMRRMVYLLIKDLKVSSNESFIVINCLSKDMTGKTDLFRANAIRVLAKIIDASLLAQIDRFLKQAIVDKNPFIVSSALVAGMHLFRVGPESVKRWVSEVQEAAVNNKSKMAQFHGLALLYKMKQHDRLAISKVVTSLTKNAPKGSLAQCLLIRYVHQTLATQNPPDKDLFKFLSDSLHSKSSSVILEAAKALARLPSTSSVFAAQTVGVLQEFLSSPSPVQRFASVRLLSELVSRYPSMVASCSVDLEHLLTDQNRSIATLAITTLLKTGQESNVDRLMKSITGFIADISDEFKIVLVDAIKTLCLKFPHKYQPLMNFLACALRDEGGADYKRAIVNAMIEVIGAIPEAKEEGLEQFCEFIEDCEFSDLSCKILHLLGTEGPSAASPAKFIRFIFNRVILETAVVRAAAVSALAALGMAVPSLQHNVIVLLKRCLADNDDEVRDRVVYYLNVLQAEHKAPEIFSLDLQAPLVQIEASLNAYLQTPQRAPFNLKKHLVEVPPEQVASSSTDKAPERKDMPMMAAGAGAGAGAVLAPSGPSRPLANPYLDLLNSIPEFANLGPLFRSSQPLQLTEEESEYQVSYVKHVYPNHVVFQFNVTNTMADQQLEEVSVAMNLAAAPDWNEDFLVPETKIASQSTGTCFVCVQRPDGGFASGSLPCELRFHVREVDNPGGDTNEDSYQLEDAEVSNSDFVSSGTEPLGLIEFKRQWEALGDGHEQVKKYTLGLDSLQAAVDAVIGLVGMAACEDSATVPEDKRSHAVTLYGVFLGGLPVLCRAGFMIDQKQSVALKIAVRCENLEVAKLLVDSVGAG